jgi:hypothetical protein
MTSKSQVFEVKGVRAVASRKYQWAGQLTHLRSNFAVAKKSAQLMRTVLLVTVLLPLLSSTVAAFDEKNPSSWVRLGISRVSGHNGPVPVPVCLNEEMGLSTGFFVGFGIACPVVIGDHSSVTLAADVDRLKFHGSGNAKILEGTAQHRLFPGDSITGNLDATMVRLNADLDFIQARKPVMNIVPRLQFVNYTKATDLKNYTRSWKLDETSSYQMCGLGGLINFNSLPFFGNSAREGSNRMWPISMWASGSLGQSYDGANYLFGDITLRINKVSSCSTSARRHRAILQDQETYIEAGTSVWHIAEPEKDAMPGLGKRKLDSVQFFLNLNMVF